MNAEVLVIGGGSAGVAAALAAARQGVETLLVERHGFMGGAGTASLVHSFCGLYALPETAGEPARVANPGIPLELEKALLQRGIGHGPVRMGRVDVLLHEPQALALLYDQWCQAEPHLRVLLHTEVTTAHVENGAVIQLSLLCRGQTQVVRPRTVVDASGDAVLAVLTGHPWEQAPLQELQRPAYIVALSGVATGTLTGDGPLKIAGCLARAIKEQVLPAEAAGAHFRSSGASDEAFLTLDLPGDAHGMPYDATDAASLSWVEMRGRAVCFQIVEHLRAHLAGFAQARVSALPVRAGVRESRRWVGETTLTEEDILHSHAPDDTIAWATWPLELRETARGPRLLYPYQPQPCGIPLRALKARDLHNVWVAGRCLSATHKAQASIRVMGTALATGQAAGLAATCSSSDTASTAKRVRSLLGPGFQV